MSSLLTKSLPLSFSETRMLTSIEIIQLPTVYQLAILPLSPRERRYRPGAAGSKVRVAFRMSHLRPEGQLYGYTIDVTNAVDNPDYCKWHFLPSALPLGGRSGRDWDHVACGSQFQGHLTGARATSCKIFARKHHKPPSNNQFQRTHPFHTPR